MHDKQSDHCARGVQPLFIDVRSGAGHRRNAVSREIGRHRVCGSLGARLLGDGFLDVFSHQTTKDLIKAQ